jgi:hypothetical protein
MTNDLDIDGRFTPIRYSTAGEKRDCLNSLSVYDGIRKSLIPRLEKSEGHLSVNNSEGRKLIDITLKDEAVTISFVDNWQLFGLDKFAYRVELNPNEPNYYSGLPRLMMTVDTVNAKTGLESIDPTSFVDVANRRQTFPTEMEVAENVEELLKRLPE